MKNNFLTGLAIFAITCPFITSCQKDFGTEQNAALTASLQSNSTQAVPNPFGVVVLPSASNENINNTSNPAYQYSLTAQNSINLAVDYGVKYYRMQIYNDKWIDAAQRQGFLYVYSQANTAGLKVLLNVCWYNTDGGAKPFPDATAYGNFLKSVLDTLNAMKLKPELIVIENEEENKNRHVIDFTTTTTMHASQQKYIDQLSVGVSICNSYKWWDGTVGQKVTNGGFTTRGITYNVWDWLKNVKKDSVAASTFAQNAFSPKTSADMSKKTVPTYITTAVDMGNYYLAAFQKIPMSVVNLHWYEPCKVRGWDTVKEGISPWALGISQDSMSPGVLDQVVAYFNYYFTIKVVAQETGQLTTSAKLNKQMTNKYLTKPYGYFDYACWYDGDSNTPYESKALHNTFITNGVDSYTKRSTGLKFEATNTALNP